MQRFGEKLRMLREQHGMSQRTLAQQLGLTAHSFVHKLETGEKHPNVELVIKIADVFGVCVDRLVRDELDLEE